MYDSGPTRISLWQLLVLAIGVLMGTSTLLPAGTPAGKDAWLAVLVAAGLGVLLTSVWQGLITACTEGGHTKERGGRGRQEGQRWEENIWVAAFGPWTGRIVSAIYFVYFTHLVTLVLRNITSLIGIEVLTRTPTPVILVALVGLAVWSASQGPEGTARLAEVVIPLAFLGSTFLVILALLTPGLVDMSQLKPVLERGYRPFFHGMMEALTFPFGELVALLPLALSLQQPARAAVPLRWAILVGGLLLAAQEVRNIAILGVHEAVRFIFPGLAVNKLIELGRVVERIETIAIFVWVNAGFIKLTVVLLAATNSVRELLDLKVHKQMPPVIAAIGLVAGALTVGLYSTDTEMVRFAADIWPVYAPIFQLIIPVLALVSARLRSRDRKNRGMQGAPRAGVPPAGQQQEGRRVGTGTKKRQPGIPGVAPRSGPGERRMQGPEQGQGTSQGQQRLVGRRQGARGRPRQQVMQRSQESWDED